MPHFSKIVSLVLVFGFSLPAFSANAAEATPALTAQQVVERMQKQSGVTWRLPTVDTFKAGDPNTPVKGIATTMMATFDVLRRAAAGGANLIITHEPTFYGHQDVTSVLEGENDAVLAAKQAFIKEHGLVIFRFHDHLHRMQPDPVFTGIVSILGWQQYQNSSDARKFQIPETTLEELAIQIKTKFGIRALRVVGDPKRKITRIGFAPGASGFAAHRRLLQDSEVEALIFGEGTEWETMEYGVDAIAQGKAKALILMGHIPSEEAGMRECAKWLKTFVTDVPVEFVVTPEPFWNPPGSR